MRITELFDELALLDWDDGLAPDDTARAAVDTRAVRRRVNATLDADPLERSKHMKQLFRKAAALAAAALCLTSAAFAAYQTEFWKEWFPNGIGGLTINDEGSSVSNGDLRLTVEQSLSDDLTTLIVYSLTAESGEGRRILADDERIRDAAHPLVELSPVPEDCAGPDRDGAPTAALSYSVGEYTKYRTDDTRVFTIHAEARGVPLLLSLTGADARIPIPTTPEAKSVAIRLDGELLTARSGDQYRMRAITLSSLGYRIDCEHVSGESRSCLAEDLMQIATTDGALHTFSEFSNHNRRWREVLDVDTIEGIVVNGTEYFADGRDPTPREEARGVGLRRVVAP